MNGITIPQSLNKTWLWVIILVVVIAAFLIVYYYSTMPSAPSPTAVQPAEDLSTTESELQQLNVDGLDDELGDIESELGL